MPENKRRCKNAYHVTVFTMVNHVRFLKGKESQNN